MIHDCIVNIQESWLLKTFDILTALNIWSNWYEHKINLDGTGNRKEILYFYCTGSLYDDRLAVGAKGVHGLQGKN